MKQRLHAIIFGPAPAYVALVFILTMIVKKDDLWISTAAVVMLFVMISQLPEVVRNFGKTHLRSLFLNDVLRLSFLVIIVNGFMSMFNYYDIGSFDLNFFSAGIMFCFGWTIYSAIRDRRLLAYINRMGGPEQAARHRIEKIARNHVEINPFFHDCCKEIRTANYSKSQELWDYSFWLDKFYSVKMRRMK